MHEQLCPNSGATDAKSTRRQTHQQDAEESRLSTIGVIIFCAMTCLTVMYVPPGMNAVNGADDDMALLRP